MTLREHLRARIVAALDTIPASDRHDLYVVSLYVYDHEDDPRRPTITVDYNTERQVAACTPAPGQEPKWPIASNADEARWNYAFWLQNALAVVCDGVRDPEGAERVRAWAKAAGFWYSDEELEQDSDAALRKVGPLRSPLVLRQICGHESGALAAGPSSYASGKPIRSARARASRSTPTSVAESWLCCQRLPMKYRPGISLTPRVWRGKPIESTIGRSIQP